MKKTKIYQHINNKKQSTEAVEKMTTKKRNSLIPISDVLATSTMFSMEALLSELTAQLLEMAGKKRLAKHFTM